MTRRSRNRSRRARAQTKRSWRLPALPISKGAAAGGLSAIALFVVMLAAVPPLWTKVKAHPYFLVTSVEVEGNRRTPDDEILALAGVHPEQSMWDISARTIGLRVQAHPWVQRAKARVEASGRVVIEVRERKPIAIVRFDQLYYVDRRGHVLGPLVAEDSRNFPIITGLEEKAHRAFAPVALPRTAQLLRWCERRGTIDGLSEVHVDHDAGITMYPADVNVAVELGWGHWRDKLSRSARVFAAWQGRLDRLAAVDVSFREIVIVRMRDGQEMAERLPKSGRRI